MLSPDHCLKVRRECKISRNTMHHYSNPKVYDPPLGKTHFRHFKMPDEWGPHIKQIIGKDGCNFIKATKRSGCMYIWHHRDTDFIEVWGPLDKIMGGENCVREIASKYINGQTIDTNSE